MLLSIDPGKVTGWSRWSFGLTRPMTRLAYGVIPGGVSGFIHWWWATRPRVDGIVFESFLLGDDFVNDRTLQASQIQGAVQALARDVPIIYQGRSVKRSVPDHVLKEHGLWLTGKDVGWEDGRDVNDSQIHALAWGKLNHEPTLERYFSETDAQPERVDRGDTGRNR